MKPLRSTVVYDDIAVEIDSAEIEAGHLWLATDDLVRATRLN
jgi:hypothetical protein